MRAPTPDATTPPVASRRQGVLRVLTEAHRPLTSAEIAEQLGVHKNTVRFHLESLIAAGQVERAELASSGPGRPAQAFRAVRGMDPGGPRHYQLLAGILTEALRSEPDGTARAIEAGRAWGRRTAATAADPIAGVEEAVEQLVHLLDTFGFAPEHDGGPHREHAQAPTAVAASGSHGRPPALAPLAVRHCPFLELAAGHQEIVCPVHLGLMRGALEAWGAPVHAEALEPFVEPDRCLVHLSASASASTSTAASTSTSTAASTSTSTQEKS
ncbi:helix-turn-helix transcriptional regulator [Ruania zhangjianzhongii]|uniref:helix-turn-helix transcriptional regulator n=1 Tax=Ruania zhangjianzhongii TaxID=2603206 RepID=UPI0011C9CD8E|nr:helix-turn-helix domain-containing protein [Ruania zhangjianzhongii]